jgi:hypothetical protein
MKKPVPVEMRAHAPASMADSEEVPDALVKGLARRGYAAAIVEDSDPMELTITRTGKTASDAPDPGALAPHVDHPFDAQEIKNIGAYLSTYDKLFGETK